MLRCRSGNIQGRILPPRGFDQLVEDRIVEFMLAEKQAQLRLLFGAANLSVQIRLLLADPFRIRLFVIGNQCGTHAECK